MDDLYVVRFGSPGSPIAVSDDVNQTGEEDEDPDEKTTFAHFGLAFYRAAVLEHELVNILAATRLLAARQDAQRLLSDPWDDNFKSTMGALVKKLGPKVQDDPQLAADLTRALRLRNHLAHAFWRDRAEDFCSDEGRARMISFLIDARRLFQDVDERLSSTIGAAAITDWGVTPEVVEAWYQDKLQRIGRGELHLPLEQVQAARQALLERISPTGPTQPTGQ
ncbi:hypothetical protein [Micromonospora sp. NPDC047527]|uniref:hypothetical protein n=1 Tax=Micromonospora sp. NPDC047527 TaxID=3155144 RepID=UPI0033F9B80E